MARDARLVSQQRPGVPIVTFIDSEKIGRQLVIHRGVQPVVGEWQGIGICGERKACNSCLFPLCRVVVPSASHEHAITKAVAMGFCQEGSRVVLLGCSAAGEPYVTTTTAGACRE